MLAVEHRDFDVDDGVTGDYAGGHLLTNALVDGRNQLGRKRPVPDAIDEFVTVTGRQRLEPELDLGELLASSGRRPNEPMLLLHGLGDGLAVRNLRPTDVRGHAELTQHAIDDDLDV